MKAQRDKVLATVTLSWDSDPSVSQSRAHVSPRALGWMGLLSRNLEEMLKRVSGRDSIMAGVECARSPSGPLPELGRKSPGHS